MPNRKIGQTIEKKNETKGLRIPPVQSQYVTSPRPDWLADARDRWCGGWYLSARCRGCDDASPKSRRHICASAHCARGRDRSLRPRATSDSPRAWQWMERASEHRAAHDDAARWLCHWLPGQWSFADIRSSNEWRSRRGGGRSRCDGGRCRPAGVGSLVLHDGSVGVTP
jgi:hypothetical protein